VTSKAPETIGQQAIARRCDGKVMPAGSRNALHFSDLFNLRRFFGALCAAICRPPVLVAVDPALVTR
jgi:hypothetical protein